MNNDMKYNIEEENGLGWHLSMYWNVKNSLNFGFISVSMRNMFRFIICVLVCRKVF